MRSVPALLAAVLVSLAIVPAAQAARSTTVRTPQGTITTTRAADGVRHMTFRWGPVAIKPGQNTISIGRQRICACR